MIKAAISALSEDQIWLMKHVTSGKAVKLESKRRYLTFFVLYLGCLVAFCQCVGRCRFEILLKETLAELFWD